MYAIRYVGRTALSHTTVDLKAQTPLILFVVDCSVLYLTSFLYKIANADDLSDALLARSSVYVASAAIGLVLGLVLGLNLGLGQLCRKVGSIAALYALHTGSFITLRFHFQ